MDLESVIFDHLKKFSAGPVVFVGSGMSQRYIGTPTWRGLLQDIAKVSGKPLQYYTSHVGDSEIKIAELMGEVLKEKIWTPEESDFLKKHQNSLTGPLSALKLYTANILEETQEMTTDPELLEEIEILKTCNKTIDLVVTTNYDNLMEEIFPDYKVYSSQDELLVSETAGVAEIYKIHGSLSDPNSLVLTETDYKDFNSRNEYLAAKLLTLFAEHPIIFIGYGMGDPDIGEIMQSLQRCLTDKHLDKLQDKLIFIDWDPAVKTPSMTPSMQVMDGSPVPVQLVVTSDFKPVFNAISKLPGKLPKKILRQIKEKIYHIILTPESGAKMLHVQNVDNVSGDDEIVIGIGAIAAVQQRGYRGVTRIELCRDCLQEESDLDYSSVVALTFIQLFQASGNFPIFKSLKKSGYLDSEGKIKKPESLPQKTIEKASDLSKLRIASSLKRKAAASILLYGSFAEIESNMEPHEVLSIIPALNFTTDELDSLRDFLLNQWDNFIDEEGKLHSSMTKAICVYDVLKYGPSGEWCSPRSGSN